MNRVTRTTLQPSATTKAQSGLTLVELMISIFLGLLVLGGVISVVLANSQAFRTNQALSEMQETARTAIELMARDIRESGHPVCTNPLSLVGIQGYGDNIAATEPLASFGTGTGQRVNGTQAINVCTFIDGVNPNPTHGNLGNLGRVTWFIGNNGRPDDGGLSLFRVRPNAAGTPTLEEVVSGVTDMTLQFREGSADDLVSPTTVSNWGNVIAVEVTMTIRSTSQNVSTNPSVNQGRLERSYTTIIGLRNRLP